MAAVQSKFSLLLVECFAGSHPVAKVAKQINEASGSTRLRVAAYVGIELDPASKHAKPTPSAEYLGLSPESWLALNGEEEVSKQPSDIQAESAGNIANLETQEAVVKFVQEQLQNKDNNIDAVLVFGGPPCPAYSQLNGTSEKANKAEADALATYRSAMQNHATVKQQSASDEEIQIASDKEKAARAAWKAASQAMRKKNAGRNQQIYDADELVQEFLLLFERIDKACESMGKSCPCFIIMENPMSRQSKALWSRPFMLPQIKNLPQRHFTTGTGKQWAPAQSAWMNVVLHHWCGYDNKKYPQKPTTIFTNMELLPPMPCCKVVLSPNHPDYLQGGHIKAKRQKDAVKAAWPEQFVHVAIKAAVQQTLCSRAKKTALDEASLITESLQRLGNQSCRQVLDQVFPAAASLTSTEGTPEPSLNQDAEPEVQAAEGMPADVEMTDPQVVSPVAIRQLSQKEKKTEVWRLLSQLDDENPDYSNASEEYKLQSRQQALASLGSRDWHSHDDFKKSFAALGFPRGISNSLMEFMKDNTLHTIVQGVEVPVCLTAAAVAATMLNAPKVPPISVKAPAGNPSEEQLTYRISPNNPALEGILLHQLAGVLAQMLCYEGPEANHVRIWGARTMEHLTVGKLELRNQLGGKSGVLMGLLDSLDEDNPPQLRKQALATLAGLIEGEIEEKVNHNITRLEASEPLVGSLTKVVECLSDEDSGVRKHAVGLIGLLAKRNSLREILRVIIQNNQAALDGLMGKQAESYVRSAISLCDKLGVEHVEDDE